MNSKRHSDTQTPEKPHVYGLSDLMKAEGYTDFEQLAEDVIMEIRSPAICTVCGYTTEMEPDQSEGWCEECEAGTMKAALILAHMI